MKMQRYSYFLYRIVLGLSFYPERNQRLGQIQQTIFKKSFLK
jgi:hypothetical protein